MTTKKIKEDPPELFSKADAVEKPVKAKEKPVEKNKVEFRDADDVSPEVAMLMEQNRILMEKLESLTGEKKEDVVDNSGKPVLDSRKPIISHRGIGYQYFEQEGNKFSAKYKYLGPIEKI